MIYKFFVYCKSDGIKEALTFVFRTFAMIFYKKSITNFYKSNGAVNVSDVDTKNIEINEMTLSNLSTIEFSRLKLLPCEEWLKKGSKLYICYMEDKPIAFTWSHFGSYNIHGIGNFILNENEYWIGPTFVHKNYRGLGINKSQIQYQMSECKGKTALTSVSANNIASIKSFEKFSFSLIGQIKCRNVFFKKNVNIFDDELKQRINI